MDLERQRCGVPCNLDVHRLGPRQGGRGSTRLPASRRRCSLELIDGSGHLGRFRYHAHQDSVGELTAHFLAAVLDRADQFAGEPLADQVVRQLGGQHDHNALPLRGRPTLLGLQADLDVVGDSVTGPSGKASVTLPVASSSVEQFRPPSAWASAFRKAGRRLPSRGPSRFRSGSTV